MKKEQCKEHPSPDSPWLTLHPFITCSPVQVGGVHSLRVNHTSEARTQPAGTRVLSHPPDAQHPSHHHPVICDPNPTSPAVSALTGHLLPRSVMTDVEDKGQDDGLGDSGPFSVGCFTHF